MPLEPEVPLLLIIGGALIAVSFATWFYGRIKYREERASALEEMRQEGKFKVSGDRLDFHIMKGQGPLAKLLKAVYVIAFIGVMCCLFAAI